MQNELTLTAVIDEVNDWKLFQGRHCCGRRVKLRTFIGDRRGLPGSYCGLFAPVDGELAHGYRMFTGERITTNAGCRHILGEEALRALILLEPTTKKGQAAIERASQAMSQQLDRHEGERRGKLGGRGTYCCCRCTVALWRTLAVGGLEAAEDRLVNGMRWLKTQRNDNGAWHSLPFHYTISALLEAWNRVNLKQAPAELRHARPAIERRLKRAAKSSDDPYTRRRRALAEHALAVAG